MSKQRSAPPGHRPRHACPTSLNSVMSPVLQPTTLSSDGPLRTVLKSQETTVSHLSTLPSTCGTLFSRIVGSGPPGARSGTAAIQQGFATFQSHADMSMDELCRKVEKQLRIPGVQVGLLKNDPAEIEAAVDLVVKVLCEREPLTRQLAQRNPTLTRESMTIFCTNVAREGAITGLSPVVKVNGTVVSVLLAAPYAPAPPSSQAQAGIEPIYDVLYKLGVEFDAYVAARTDKPKFLEWCIGTVDERFRGYRMLTLTPQLTMKNAQAMGFTDALGKTTSHSQDILDTLGWTTIAELPYLTYEYAGERCFANVEPHERQQAKLQVVNMETFWRTQYEFEAAQRDKGFGI
ncbi:hypothetical protein BC834DRAFT_965111 [Gloeopeniophorella convolvens]|nr:hypothetical protein BC834DRAFT_965111 [Gloeopeniophorella convolvens]